MRAQARKLEAMGRLTGGIAHDLNNLLTIIIIIIGNLEFLTEQSVRPDLRELISEALDAALGGADLTWRLLAFSRREAMLSPQSDLNAVIVGMVSMLARTLGANITLDLALAFCGRSIWIRPNSRPPSSISFPTPGTRCQPGDTCGSPHEMRTTMF